MRAKPENSCERGSQAETRLGRLHWGCGVYSVHHGVVPPWARGPAGLSALVSHGEGLPARRCLNLPGETADVGQE